MAIPCGDGQGSLEDRIGSKLAFNVLCYFSHSQIHGCRYQGVAMEMTPLIMTVDFIVPTREMGPSGKRHRDLQVDGGSCAFQEAGNVFILLILEIQGLSTGFIPGSGKSTGETRQRDLVGYSPSGKSTGETRQRDLVGYRSKTEGPDGLPGGLESDTTDRLNICTQHTRTLS